MALSTAERQKRLRARLKLREIVTVTIPMPAALHAKLKRQAKKAGRRFRTYLLHKLGD